MLEFMVFCIVAVIFVAFLPAILTIAGVLLVGAVVVVAIGAVVVMVL